MRAALVWAALFALVLWGVWDSRTSVPLKPASIPQIHQPPAQQQADRSKSGKANPTKEDGAFLPQTVEAVGPDSQRRSSNGLPGSKGDEKPASGEPPPVFWAGIKFTDVITLSVAVVGAVIAGLQLATYRRQADIMDGQLKATEQAAKAAVSSVRVAEDTLTISQRPWVTVDVRLVGPMTYTADGADFAFEYTMENVGNTPALRVFPQPILYAKTKRMPSEDVVLTNYITSRTDPTEDPLGFTIGPKARHVFTTRQHVSREDVEQTRKSYMINGQATNILPVKFVGIVAYRSVVSKRRHETSFYYDVMKLNDDDPPTLVGLSVLDQEIRAEKLALVKNILFSPYMT